MERIEAIAPQNLSFREDWLNFEIGDLFQIDVPVLREANVDVNRLAGPHICLRTRMVFPHEQVEAALILSGEFSGRLLTDYQMRETGGLAVEQFIKILLRDPGPYPADGNLSIGSVHIYEGALWVWAQDVRPDDPATVWVRIDGNPGERGLSRRRLGHGPSTCIAKATIVAITADPTVVA